MQKLLLIIGLLAVSNLHVWSQTAESPGAYATRLSNEYIEVSNRNLEYLQYSVHSDDIALIEQKRLALIQQIQKSYNNVKAIPPYQGDSRLRDEMLAVFEAYMESFKVEFKQVNLLKQNSKASFEAMEQYLNASNEAEKKLDIASSRAIAAQVAFARKYNIKLTEDEEKANSVKLLNNLNNYHRAIFLRIFKVSKKDAEFSDALSRQSIPDMERARRELERICDENLLFLERLPDFKGDATYRDAAKDFTRFYQDMASQGYKTLIAVLRKGDKRTNEDVDAFNSIIQRCNEEPPALNDKANEAADQLFKKYVPKPVETRRI